jgi:hypothetical protein
MKYLKRFNEELKSDTYLRASRKLKKLGHTDRAKELQEWGAKVERDEEMIKWKERMQDFGPFGTFKLNVENPDTGESLVGDFYLDITFDELAFSDDPDGGFGHFVGIIPTSEELITKCDKLMPCAEFGNGFYWGFIFNLEYEIVNEQVQFKKFNFWDYDDNLSGHISFADRSSANKFKNLMIKMYSDPQLGYPSGYNDANDIWEKLNSCILVQNSFSSDYGFQLENVAEYIRTISPNLLYKTV